jgi:phosphate transport system substrate-binding protein
MFILEIRTRIPAAVLLLGLAACNDSRVAADTAGPLELGRASQALLGNDIFGSDTLFDAMTAAFAAAPTTAPLVYLGTGSGNGERCIRGQAPPDVCLADPPVQALAPMSRALNNPLPGEVNIPIAIDGIAIVGNAAAADPGLALADVLTAFCGADGLGLDAETSCAAPNRLAGAKFRRDDSSGTTEVFEQLSGCSAFCADVQIVDEAVTGPSIGGVLPAACEAADSATSCIGKLVAADASAVGYAGGSVLNVAGTQAFPVNGVAFAEGTLQALVSDPANAYAFARFVFLNANLTNLVGTGSVQEEFFEWATSDDPGAFEAILVSSDFIACSPTAPLSCQPSAPSGDAGASDAGDAGVADGAANDAGG